MSASTSAFGSPTRAASTSATASASEIVSIVVLIFICARYLKDMNLGEESFYLRLHRGVGLIGGCKFGCILDGGGCTFVFVDLEARHHLIYDGVGVVEATFVNCSTSLSDLKASFSEVVLENLPSFVRQSGAFPHTDAAFENSLFVDDNEGDVDCLTLG